MRFLAALVGTGLLAGSAGADRRTADQAALAEARPVGAPIDCVTLTGIHSTRVRDDRTIDFFMRDGRIFRNRLAHRRAGLGFEDSFSYRTSLPRLCSVDLISVRTTSGVGGATCGLGGSSRSRPTPASHRGLQDGARHC